MRDEEELLGVLRRRHAGDDDVVEVRLVERVLGLIAAERALRAGERMGRTELDFWPWETAWDGLK